MQQQLKGFLAGLALASLANGVLAAPPISDARARVLLPAVARIMLQRDTTTGLLQYCGQRFVSLKPESDHSRKTWLQRNRPILHKAAVLHDLLWLSLKQQQSGLKAETFNLDIDQLVQQNVRKKVHALADYSPVQQHTLCNRLILAVRAGDWDLKRKQAAAVTILQNFH